MQVRIEQVRSIVEQTYESKCGTLCLFLPAELEADPQSKPDATINQGVNVLFATLKRHLHLVFAHGALQPQYNLLRCFCLRRRSSVSRSPK
jgi:hypothetical protein